MVRSRQTITKISATTGPDPSDAARAPEPEDWNKANAAFVAAYNELIDAEGVALEEYRLF